MRAFHLLPLVAFLSLSACDSADGETVAGTYTITRFRADVDDDNNTPLVDVLALGASLTMTLGDDGALSGILTLPESLTGEEIEAVTPFGGTYVSSPSTVTFRSDPDLFLNGQTWTFDDGQIRRETADISAVFEKR